MTANRQAISVRNKRNNSIQILSHAASLLPTNKWYVLTRIQIVEADFITWLNEAGFLKPDQHDLIWDDIPIITNRTNFEPGEHIMTLSLKIPQHYRTCKEDYFLELVNYIVKKGSDLYHDRILIGQFGSHSNRICIAKQVGGDIAFFCITFNIEGNTVNAQITYRSHLIKRNLGGIGEDRPVLSNLVRKNCLPNYTNYDSVFKKTKMFSRFGTTLLISCIIVSIASALLFSGLRTPEFNAKQIDMNDVNAVRAAIESNHSERIARSITFNSIWTVLMGITLVVCFIVRLITPEMKLRNKFVSDLRTHVSFVYLRPSEDSTKLIQTSDDHRNFFERMMQSVQKFRDLSEMA